MEREGGGGGGEGGKGEEISLAGHLMLHVLHTTLCPLSIILLSEHFFTPYSCVHFLKNASLLPLLICFLPPHISCQPLPPLSSSPRQLACRWVRVQSAGQSPAPVIEVLCTCTRTDGGTPCLGQTKLHPQVVIKYLMSPSSNMWF